MTKNQNWKSLTRREKFLFTMKEINNTLVEDQRLTKKEILALYDSEIAPYGYPSHQDFFLQQAIQTLYFNENIQQGRYENYKNAPIYGDAYKGLPDLGDGFSGKPVAAHYITDALAHSLLNTDTPKDNNLIRQAMSLNVLPILPIVFSNEFSLGEDVCSNLTRISIMRLENELDIQVFSGNKKKGYGGIITYKFCIPFVEHDCCQLCAAQEHFSKNNLGDRIFYRALALGVAEGTVTERENKLAEDCIVAFQNETIPKIYKFVINLLCLMTQQPDIISVQKSSTKYVAASDKGFSSHKVNNVPNVHWLGADFTTKVQYSREIGSELIDISRGKPKKSHWRRGHWHTISQGPGRLQKKLRWFEPVFIQGNKKTSSMEEN